MSHWWEEWTPNIVLNNYNVLGVVDPEDIRNLVKDANQLQKVLEVIKDDYPEVYADLILKNIL